MPVDRVLAEDEPGRNLTVRQSLGQQGEHLSLAWRHRRAVTRLDDAQLP